MSEYLLDTRLGAPAKATEAILESYSAITDDHSNLYSGANLKGDTKLQDNNSLQKMKELELSDRPFS